MTYPLEDEPWQQMQEAFRIFDTDGDGLVTASDLRVLMLTYGMDHSEEELTDYLNDLPIILDGDAALDKTQFVLWIMKLHERLMTEDRQEQIDAEQEIQDVIEVGALAPTQAAEERKKLEEKREDRKQLEAIIQGEIAALDEELFARLDVGGKGFLTPDDLKHLATASGEEWDELVIDSMFHAVCQPDAPRRISPQHFRKIMQAEVCWDEPSIFPCHKRVLAQKAQEEKAQRRKARRKPPPASHWRRNLAIGLCGFIVFAGLILTIILFSLGG